MSDTDNTDILIDISTAIMRVHNGQLQCRLVSDESDRPRLPFGPFMPDRHRTMEISLRQWVGEQVGVDLAHVEQLYTFADQGRYRGRAGDAGNTPPDKRKSRKQIERHHERHVVSVGYLALTPTADNATAIADEPDAPQETSQWDDVYRFFPWEDWRDGRPEIIDSIIPALEKRLTASGDATERIRLAFGQDDMAGDEEFVLERYELLYQAGLVTEAAQDGHRRTTQQDEQLGLALQLDHRRILATALGRLRGKLKYRPVIFDLMPERFTLRALQQTTELVVGANLHKQNFRRLVEKSGLVEPTGVMERARGRPAELFQMRQTDSAEPTLAGLRVSAKRNKRTRH